MDPKRTLKPEDKPKRTRRKKETTSASVIADVLPKLEALDAEARTRVLKVINSYFE